MKNVRPLHDRLMVRRIEEKETAKGGIIIPDTAKEKPQEGEVLAVGNGKILDNGTKLAPAASTAPDRGVIWVMAGLIAGLAAYTLTMIPGDRLILREDEVLAVLG